MHALVRTRRAAAAGVVGLVALAAVACSGGGDDEAATTTTVDPMLATVTDACGNDLTALASTVWAVEPETGQVVWQVSVPLAEAYLLSGDAGGVVVPLTLRSVGVVLDPFTGERLDVVPSGVHEVLVDETGDATGVPGMQVIDGEQRPEGVTVEDQTVELVTTGGTVALRGVAPDGGSTWTSPLSGTGGDRAAHPLVVSELVVVSAPAQDVPSCP